MTFEENPFRVLNVSIYADKATIIERADDLSFADPDREEIIEHARDILLNPRKRIAAEMRWFVGCSQAKELKCVADCLSKNVSDDDDGEYLSSLAYLNFQVYKLENNTDSLADSYIIIDAVYQELDIEKIRKQINAARVKSQFPIVQDTAAIRDELKNLRDEIRGMIQETLKAMSHVECAKLANEMIDMIIEDKEDFGVVIEDFFDSYRLQMTPFLDENRKRIISFPNKIKDNVNKEIIEALFRAAIILFADAMRPLDKFSEALGTNNFAATEKIFYTVRDVAIKLFNENNLIDYPLKIIHLLQSNFSYLPHLSELIRKDIQFLEETKANRPTQAFLDAKAALDTIQKAIDRHLHFTEGFEGLNEAFYSYQFKPIHERTLQGLMFQSRYKPDEWQYLNALAATIYLKVGNAMTWARRADLAFDSFQKALPYAEASGDKELIALTRKRADEWKGIAQKVAARSDDNGCLNWLGWIIIIGIIYLLVR